MKKAGYFILMIGLALTIFTAVTFFTKERVAKIGEVNIMANKRHHLQWSPVIGVLVMGLGGVIVWRSPKS